MRDIGSENLSTVNKLYYFPGHDLISGKEVALGRFPLIFLTGARSKRRSTHVPNQTQYGSTLE